MRDVLHDVLKRIDPEQRLRVYDLWNFWNEEVGATLAHRAQPSAFRNGVLIVTVAQHAWLQELQFVKDELREHLNARLGGEMIRDIYFVSGVVNSTAATAKKEEETPPAEITPRRTLALPEIKNPDLAAAFARIAKAHTRRVSPTPERPTPRRRSRRT